MAAPAEHDHVGRSCRSVVTCEGWVEVNGEIGAGAAALAPAVTADRVGAELAPPARVRPSLDVQYCASPVVRCRAGWAASKSVVDGAAAASAESHEWHQRPAARVCAIGTSGLGVLAAVATSVTDWTGMAVALSDHGRGTHFCASSFSTCARSARRISADSERSLRFASCSSRRRRSGSVQRARLAV